MSKGIPCPGCGGVTSRVIGSRYANGRYRRRRVCQSCDQRFTTFESYVRVQNDDAAEKVRKIADLNQRMAKLISSGTVPAGRGLITWTADMDAALKGGVADGLTQSALAIMIGVDVSVVRRRINELGLPVNRPWAGKRARAALETKP